MDRLQRVARLWNWLPAFRAVADTEHVGAAAKRLLVSPSALSRTIRLLEEDIGEALFRRVGRTLELTDAGREMLLATREAMQRIDGALDVACGTRWTGALRVACEGRLATVHVLPALRNLRRQHPAIVPHLVRAAGPELVPAVLSGQLDMAITHRALAHEDITTVALGQAGYGVYCGVGHPLHDVPHPTLEMVLAHPFAAPVRDGALEPGDNWPAEVPRRIGMYSDMVDGAAEPCAHGDFLAVFPDSLVATFAYGTRLRRLPIDVVPPQTLYAVKRDSAGRSSGPLDMVIHDLRTDFARRSLHVAA